MEKLLAILTANASAIGIIVSIITLAIGVVALFKGFAEYVGQNALKRFEKFQEVRRHFKGNEEFKRVCLLLEDGDPELRRLDYKAKQDFLGFFEEIALMHNSKIINSNVAHYMFGYYAIRCYESKDFWNGVSRESYYWSLFAKFAQKMKVIEDRTRTHTPDVSSFRF
jgi:hypothetical protein